MDPPVTIPAYALYGEEAATLDGVHCERIVARAPKHAWEIFAHRHDHIMQVILLEQGQASGTAEGRSFKLQAGDFCFIPPQKVHGFSFSNDSDGFVLSLPREILGALGAGQKRISELLQTPFTGRQAAPFFGTVKALLEPPPTGQFQKETLLGVALILLAGLAAEIASGNQVAAAQTRPALLDRFDSQIAEDFAAAGSNGTRSAGEHARKLGLTLGHLSRICRNSTGQGAAAHLEKRRVEEACRLLAYTALSVSQIAFRLGYKDPSYFSRRFRQSSGETPSQYRARVARRDAGA